MRGSFGDPCPCCGHRPWKSGNPWTPSSDELSIALGSVVFEAVALCDSLLVLRRGPGSKRQVGTDTRTALERIARECICMKTRSLLDFLAREPKGDDLSITNFHGRRLVPFGPKFSALRRFINRRSLHLTGERLEHDLTKLHVRTGYYIQSFGATVLDVTMRFVDDALQEGVTFTTKRHPAHYKALVSAYRILGTERPRRVQIGAGEP